MVRPLYNGGCHAGGELARGGLFRNPWTGAEELN